MGRVNFVHALKAHARELNMALALRQDIHFCIASRIAAFLDLRSNRYFSLPFATDQAFQKLIGGEFLDLTSRDALTPMIANGVLVDNAEGLNPPTPTTCRKAHTSFEDQSMHHTHDWRVLTAATQRISTGIRVNMTPFSEIIEAMRIRKIRRPVCPLHIAHVESHLRAYLATRRLLSTQDQCLRWSIGLVDYLAKRQFYPDLVLGVKMKPFAAHAWVQSDGVILNDSIDRVLQYTPILVV